MATTKLIPGYCRDLAHKFSCSCEYITSMMLAHEVELFEADLLTANILTPTLNISRNKILVGYISNNLEWLLERFEGLKLSEARLFYRLDLTAESIDSACHIKVQLNATDGCLWSGKYVNRGPLLVAGVLMQLGKGYNY